MQRRNFLRLAAALPLTALTGCGSGWNLGFGPIRGGGGDGGSNTGGNTPGLVGSTGRIILPVGSPLARSTLSLTSGFHAAVLGNEGAFTLEQLDKSAALLTLLDASQKPVLLGFSGSDATGMVGEVSPLQTSVALLFYALGAFTLPADAQERVRMLLTSDKRVQTLAKQLETLLAANPYALADSDPTLVSAVTTLRDELFPSTSRAMPASGAYHGRSEPTVTTLIQTSPSNELYGFFAAPNGDKNLGGGLGLTIMNTKRRNAIVSILEVAYTGEDKKIHTIKDGDFVRHAILDNEFLYSTSGLAGVLGSLIDVANGTVAYGPVTNGPYNLDLFPSNAIQADYKIAIVANGNGGDSQKLLAEDFSLFDVHNKVCFLTFGKDVFLPALATVIGFQAALKEVLNFQKFAGTELLKAFDDLAVILTGVVDSSIAISAGSVRSLLVAVFKAMANNGTLRQKVIEWLLFHFVKRAAAQGLVTGGLAALHGAIATALASNLNVIIIAIDKLMGLADLGAVLYDWGNNESYIRFDAKVIASKMKVFPNASILTAGASVDLKVSPGVDAADLTYHWKIVQGAGTLKNLTSGLMATELDSSTNTVQYQSEKVIANSPTILIDIEAFIGGINDPKRTSLGVVRATVDLFSVGVTPKNARLNNGQSVTLQADVVGTRTLGAEDQLTYKWKTTRNVGELLGSPDGGLAVPVETAAVTYQASAGNIGQDIVTLEVILNGRSLGKATSKIAVAISGAADISFSNVVIPENPQYRYPIEFTGGNWMRNSNVRISTWFGKNIYPISFDGPGGPGIFGSAGNGVAFDFFAPLQVGSPALALNTAHNWLSLKWTNGQSNTLVMTLSEGSVTVLLVEGKRVEFALTGICRSSPTPVGNPSYYEATVNLNGWFLVD